MAAGTLPASRRRTAVLSCHLRASAGSSSRPAAKPAAAAAAAGGSGVHIGAPALQEFVQELLAAKGSSAEEARVVAAHLVEANLKGHDSHGVGMVPQVQQ